ncbi:MAG: carboxypeptidase regulatory-like domain-containing protein [Bacteroidetes bacterium]|nr:carboxypeptidase regulatory-like domain-containing protein [Bacteroidota bacterium]
MRAILRIAATLFIIVIFTLKVTAQIKISQRMLVKIYLENKEEVHRLDDMALDFATLKIEEFAQVVVTQSELNEINLRGFLTEVIAYPDRAHIVDPEYHTYEEVLVLMDSLANVYPDITKLDTIGESQELGLVIQAMKISDNPGIEEDEPAILFDGLHHAREPVSMESCLAILEHLLINYGTDTTVTNWVDNIEIWIIPLLNPDGWKYVVEENLANPWWRKNQRDNNENGTFDPDYDGVDINRNYDYNWAIGGSGDPSSWTYRGPAPFSEKEAQAKRDLALSQKFVLSISYHSHGEIVIYSWSDVPPAPDQQLIIDIADSIASRIPLFSSGGSYEPTSSNCTNGFSRCWMYVVAGSLEYTVETAPEFIPPGPDGIQIAQDNVAGALYLLDRVFGPGLTGHITDAFTGEPLLATVKVLEIFDPVLTPRTSDELYGRYFRLLLPGTYSIEISKEGYETVTVNNVQVNPGYLTQLDVQMDSTMTSADKREIGVKISGKYVLHQNYPNPFSSQTVISYQLPINSKVSLKIYNILGEEITILVDAEQKAGEYSVIWDGKDSSGGDLNSGFYIYSLEAENNFSVSEQSKKIFLIR